MDDGGLGWYIENAGEERDVVHAPAVPDQIQSCNRCFRLKGQIGAGATAAERSWCQSHRVAWNWRRAPRRRLLAYPVGQSARLSGCALRNRHRLRRNLQVARGGNAPASITV